MNVPWHVAKVSGDPPLDPVDVDLVALAVDFFNHPHVARDGHLVANWGRLDDRAQLF